MNQRGSRLVVARWVARSLKRKFTGPDDDGFVVQELLDALVEIGWTPPSEPGLGTCDWGYCNLVAVGMRTDPRHSDELPVCAIHLASAGSPDTGGEK